MKLGLAWMIRLAVIVGSSAHGLDDRHARAIPYVADQKELLDDVQALLRFARAGIDQWQSLPDRIGLAVYYAGVKDGAVAAAIVLVVIYLLYRHRKAT